MLDDLQDIEIASGLVDFDADNEDSLDEKYKKLYCDITPLPHDSEVFQLVQYYLHTTHAPTHTAWNLELEDVFALEREGKLDQFAPNRNKLQNKMLLWHGAESLKPVILGALGHHSSAPQICSTIEDLTDDLLFEVFRKLPSVKEVIRSGLVSRNWTSVIATQFVPKLPCGFFGLFYNTCPLGERRRDRWEFVCLEDCISEGVKSSLVESCLSSASTFPPDQYLDFNDGLVLTSQPHSQKYFLSNPFTQQWVHIPYALQDQSLYCGAVTYGSHFKVVNFDRSSCGLLNIYSSISMTHTTRSLIT